MRKVWGTAEWPATEVDATAAHAAGAAEIVHLPCPALPQLTLGYNEVAEFGDTRAEQVTIAIERLQARREVALVEFRASLRGADYVVALSSATRADIAATIHALSAQPTGVTVQWEIVDGVYLDLDLTDLEMLRSDAFVWTQACFARSCSLNAEIESADAPLAVNIEDGWPS